ncbi:HTH domain-containing protein [Halopiger goleimassiliensis]|uniref:HTH domain-containing protein n=1 Tax=Halopiger goleimassiliensis TaxID=1293048 RepID=UPI000677B2C6|nr:HTH domain-containing protein [Halopiger goleimassiliensis]
MPDDHSASRTIELWVRSFSPTTTGPSRRRALERATRLESSERVDAVEIDVWGSEVECGTLSPYVPRLERIESRLETFEKWAARTGRRLEPFFRRRRLESTITGERREVWQLPTVALAEFDGDRLVHVAPCRDGDRTIDVFDRLEALADDGSDGSVVRYDGDRWDDEVISETETDQRAADHTHRVGPSSGPN